MIVVKIKRSASDATRQLVVADKERRFVEFAPPLKPILAALDGAPEGYFEAEREEGQWKIGKKLPDQNW
jgi:hypothetical protein